MKYTYLSPNDFQLNCPCSYSLTGYAESLFSPSAKVIFWKGSKARGEENAYTAEYFVSVGQSNYRLEVSCTILPDGTNSFKTLSKTYIS